MRQAGSRPQRLGSEALLRLGRRYRAAAADLALARRLFPGHPVTRLLERLVTEARQSVYATEPRRRSLRAFLATGYWQRVLERPLMLGLALALLFVPMALAIVWAIDDPAAAIGIVPAGFEGAIEPGSHTGDPETAEAAAASSALYTNNIRVTFMAVAGGVLLGLGTVAVTIFNGGLIGAIFGLTIENGAFDELLRFVLPHGLLELTCIVVSGMAGLRLGWAIVDPGPLTRGASLRREARTAIEIVLGTMPWLVLAGVIEGFVSPRQLPLPPPRGRRVRRGRVLGAVVVARSRAAPRLGPQVGGDAGGRQPVGGRLDDLRAGPPQHVRHARARAEHVERHGLRAEGVGVVRRRREHAVEVGVAHAGDGDRVAAREHRHRVDQRPSGGLLQQVAEDQHQRALGALDAAEGELVVGLLGARLEVEQRPHHRAAAGPPGSEPAPHLTVERERARTVAEHVGDQRDRHGGVDRHVEPRALAER